MHCPTCSCDRISLTFWLTASCWLRLEVCAPADTDPCCGSTAFRIVACPKRLYQSLPSVAGCELPQVEPWAAVLTKAACPHAQGVPSQAAGLANESQNP